MAYPFLPLPETDGEAQLLAINSYLKLADHPVVAYSPAFSDIFDFSEFAGEDWVQAQISENGFNFLSSWKSLQGSVLTQVQSAAFTEDESEDDVMPGYDQFDHTHLGLSTFSTKNGDKFSIARKNLSTHKTNDDWHNENVSTQIYAKYVGLQGAVDDVTYSCQSNQSGWAKNDYSQWQYTDVVFLSGKTSAFSIKTNGTFIEKVTNNNSVNPNTFNLKLAAYSYTDADNGLALSFGGTIFWKNYNDYTKNNVDINLKKVIATTADYKCTTAVLDVRNEKDFNFNAFPTDNYSQVTTTYFDKFESIMMRAANIITITNKDGAYVDADNGADKVIGSASSDVIKGGAGKDIITGGLGADLFVYGRETAGFIKSLASDSGNINNGSSSLRDFNRDTIADFKPGEDQIGIDAREIGWDLVLPEISEILPSQFKIFAAGTIFTSAVASTAPLNQGVTTGPFNNSYLMLVLGATSSVLYIDLDAGGTVFNPVALATLMGVTTTTYTTAPMTNTDFLLLG